MVVRSVGDDFLARHPYCSNAYQELGAMSSSRVVTSGLLAVAFASVAGLGVLLYTRGELTGPAALFVVAGLVALACGAVLLQGALTDREQAIAATKRVHAEEKRVRAEELSRISHLLRTPLNAIVGWTEILRFDHGDNHVRAIEAIERNAFAQAQLIDEALGGPKKTSGPVAIRLNDPPLNLRVLIVEDDEDSATTLRTLLTDRGCEVRVAHSVNECLELYLSARPDVLLCDIGLPDGDGYALLHALRTAAPMPEVPAIALSALARDEDRTRAATVGFADYLTKPYHVDDLVDHIRRVAISAPPLHAPGLDR
jgi:CheY-like chemotaxis protein